MAALGSIGLARSTGAGTASSRGVIIGTGPRSAAIGISPALTFRSTLGPGVVARQTTAARTVGYPVG